MEKVVGSLFYPSRAFLGARSASLERVLVPNMPQRAMKQLPYTRKRSSRPVKQPQKRPIVERRAIPEIFVQVRDNHYNHRSSMAKAHIRVRRGCYRFLVWRDGDKVKEFYLGRLRQAAPTEASSSSDVHQVPAPATVELQP